MKALDITGQKFGHLTAIERILTPVPGKTTPWRFICDCGQETIVSMGNAKSGNTISCGCMASRKTIGQFNKTHGHTVGGKKSRTSAAWRNAKTRCFNPNNWKRHRYSERGITMCEAWSNDFAIFLRDMGECPPGMTLDRIDNDGNYEPGNCRWISAREQSKNRSTNIKIQFGNENMVLSDFSKLVGIGYSRLRRRIKEFGESPIDAFHKIIGLDFIASAKSGVKPMVQG